MAYRITDAVVRRLPGPIDHAHPEDIAEELLYKLPLSLKLAEICNLAINEYSVALRIIRYSTTTDSLATNLDVVEAKHPHKGP
jgi:hypothetical protein